VGSLSPAKLRHALMLLALAESPILLQLLHLDRSYLFFAFSLAWATALYTFIEPPRRALWLGLLVYVATASISVPLLLAWLGPERDPALGQGTAAVTHQLIGFVFGVGVREELCKTAALFLLLALGRLAGLRFTSREGMVFGAMSGLAFAAAENLQAVRSASHMEEVLLAHGLPANATIALALGRLALTPLAHACWSSAVGFACTVPVASLARRATAITAALLGAVFLHGLYDESAALGNRVGVGVLLALSFATTLVLASRSESASAAAMA
jgi:protease PrsW